MQRAGGGTAPALKMSADPAADVPVWLVHLGLDGRTLGPTKVRAPGGDFDVDDLKKAAKVAFAPALDLLPASELIVSTTKDGTSPLDASSPVFAFDAGKKSNAPFFLLTPGVLPPPPKEPSGRSQLALSQLVCAALCLTATEAEDILFFGAVKITAAKIKANAAAKKALGAQPWLLHPMPQGYLEYKTPPTEACNIRPTCLVQRAAPREQARR